MVGDVILKCAVDHYSDDLLQTATINPDTVPQTYVRPNVLCHCPMARAQQRPPEATTRVDQSCWGTDGPRAGP